MGAVPQILGVSYDSYSGTSMAAPYVSGLAPLLLSVNPNLGNDQLMAIMKDTTVDVEDQGWDSLTDYGRIDAGSAVAAVQAATTVGISPAIYLPLITS